MPILNGHQKKTIEIAARDAELVALRDGIADLRRYLLSDKFREDTTVQVTDVLLRLDELQSAATDVRMAMSWQTERGFVAEHLARALDEQANHDIWMVREKARRRVERVAQDYPSVYREEVAMKK